MAYLTPKYNNRIGFYSGNKTERFGTIPANVFTPNSLGGVVFIPVNKGLTAAPSSTANAARYTYPLIHTYDDQRSNIQFGSQKIGLSIDNVNYDTFDFVQINPTIDMLSWRASNGVYDYTSANYQNLLYNLNGITYSGVELRDVVSVSPKSGRQIISFYVPGTASFTFASYTSNFGYENQVKVYFYNFTDTYNLTYAGSYSTAGLLYNNYVPSSLL